MRCSLRPSPAPSRGLLACLFWIACNWGTGAEQVIADHATCYPPADPATPGTVLEPLYPTDWPKTSSL